MEDSFVQLLESLGNEDESLDRTRLADLSDLDVEHFERFASTWQQLPDPVRLRMLELLGQLADAQIELDFEPINRMAVTDSASEVREQAIENLWESEDPALVELFLTALERDPSERVRSAAAEALGSFVLLAETRSLPDRVSGSIEAGLLHANRHDNSEQVRIRSLESLGFSSRSEVAGLIETAYESESEDRLQAALRAMARSANPRWAGHVLKRIHHPSPRIRLEAAQAIGEIEARQAVEELIELIEDVDDRVRRAAIWSLGQLGGQMAAETLHSLIESSEDYNESELVQDALDNMDFIQSTRELLRHEGDGLEGPAD